MMDGKPRNCYFRLLGYVKPYWFRLTIGILTGALVGGSLFVTLMMIPQMVGAVSSDPPPPQVRGSVRAEDDSASHLAAEDPQLAKMLHQAKEAAEKFHLPFSVEGTSVHVRWPRDFTFDAVGPNGRVAWQLFGLYATLFLLVWTCKNVAHYINGNEDYLKAHSAHKGERARWKWDTINLIGKEFGQSSYSGWIIRTLDFPETDHVDLKIPWDSKEGVELAAVLLLPDPDLECRADLRKVLFGLNCDPFLVP